MPHATRAKAVTSVSGHQVPYTVSLILITGNIPINKSENTNNDDGNKEGKLLIIYDQEKNTDFNEQYGFGIEDIIERMTPEDKELFYKLLNKKSGGRPGSFVDVDPFIPQLR